MLIAKDSFKHENFFPEGMTVALKVRTRFISHNAGGMAAFSFLTGKDFTCDTLKRARLPSLVCAIYYNLLAEI